jgi:uncharacterized protein YkwD
MSQLAQRRASQCALSRTIGHAGFSEALAELYGPGHAAAENMAAGQQTEQDVVRCWIASPGHHDNILGLYQYIGVGMAEDSVGVRYWTTIFMG